MRFSLWPFNQHSFSGLRDICVHAEATGWDGVWISDHFMPSGPPLDAPVLECWTTSAAIAALVPRLRIGTLVVGNAFRHPAVVAKMAAGLDTISGGRFVLGLGTAGGDLPLLLGVKGDRALGLAARHADEWNLWATPERFLERSALLAAHCETIGRDPAEIRRSAQALFRLGDTLGPDAERWQRTGLPTMTGGVEELCDLVGAYEEAGVDELVIPDFALAGEEREDALDTFVSEVAARFR